MKSNDIEISNIHEIKAVSPSSSSKESRASRSTGSNDSSPSDLRKRLEDLPSPNEFISLTDRVATLGRRICRKREVFLHLHEANRIEENDEWEKREQRAGLENLLEVSTLKDARARRRARVCLEASSPRSDDKTMVIPQTGVSTGLLKIIGDDDKLNPTESLADRSARDNHLRLPAIAIPRDQSRPSSLSEPSSTRLFHRNGESGDIKSKTTTYSCRNFPPRERASKSIELPSVSPFSLSSVQPKKFGGYRPPSGIILKNLSSSSESESTNDTNRGLSTRKIGSTVATLELSSPESTAVSSINGPIKKMPIMSARNDIIGSILPNLLPSSRSLDNDALNHPIATSRSYPGQVNRDETKACNEPGKANTLVEDIFNERASHDGFAAKISSELGRIKAKYEDTRYQQQEISQATSTFFAGSFMPESAELVTSTYNERVVHDEPAMKAYNEFTRVGSEFEDETKKIHQDDTQYQFEFNCPTDRRNFEGNSLRNNGDVLDIAERSQTTSLYTKDAVDTPNFIETTQNDVTEEALSSQPSEPYGSEDHSRSSCMTKLYLQREAFSSRRAQNGIDTSDKCDREIMTRVPTLALNSQDISYSTSAGSRECSATRPFDPHALIKALSDISLKQEIQGEDVSRKREGFYHGENTINISNGASDFPTKGETWRVPEVSTSESPRKPLSRVPSKIPVRISSSKIIPPGDKPSGCLGPENSGETANYATLKFIEQNDVTGESVVHSQICERDPSSGSWNKGIEVTIAEGAFAPVGDAMAEFKINDRAPGSATSPNLQSYQSTPFGDYSYDKTQRLPGCTFQGESYPPGFFSKAAYSSGRDYAGIDDDVRSRSDRSTSRKSADTVDVTSATESPGLFKYRRTESSQIESLRNVENITWRTEDECVSINDEENPEDTRDKDYASPEVSYLRENERYKLTVERMYDPSPSRIRQLNSSSETQKGGGRKRHAGDDLELDDGKTSFDQNRDITKTPQSENLTFQVRRTQELSSFAARRSSSTLNLNCESKRKKKSQERFPFTISEAPAAPSAKHENYQSLDENFGRKMDNKLQEKTAIQVYQLKTHPSVTRLATSGTEDTVADILSCVEQEKKENTMSKSKIKALVRIFSSKLRKTPKEPNDETLEPTKIIYENNACQEDSKVNSCSDDSATEEARKIHSSNRWMDHRAARSKTMLVSSWETLKKTDSLQPIAQEHLHRRYDRDDLWVQNIKDSSFDERKDGEILQRKDEANRSKENTMKDRYSIFLAKNPPQSNKSSRDNTPKEQLISDHVTPSDGKGKRSIDRKSPSNFVSEVEEIEEELTDCLCWRLCRIIAPSKYRSPIKEQVPASRTKRPDSLLQKRKK